MGRLIFNGDGRCHQGVFPAFIGLAEAAFDRIRLGSIRVFIFVVLKEIGCIDIHQIPARPLPEYILHLPNTIDILIGELAHPPRLYFIDRTRRFRLIFI